VMSGFFKQQAIKAVIYLGQKKAQRKFSNKPIIVGACPRSGTTLLLSILGAHPHIFAIPTQTYAFDLWKETKAGISSHIPGKLERFYGYLLLNRIPRPARRWCEKTPKNIQSFNKILDYFGENAQLINMFRDGRDVVTSSHPKHSPGKYWVSNERWIKDVSIGLSFENHPQVLNFRYEDLVNQFEPTLKKIYKFLDEPLPDDLYSWVQNTNIKESKHWGGSVQNLYSNSINRWQNKKHSERVNAFMGNEEAVALLKKLHYLD